MPDICMCQSEDCPKKEECYRYKAKPDTIQSYCNFYKGKECEYFLKLTKKQ